MRKSLGLALLCSALAWADRPPVYDDNSMPEPLRHVGIDQKLNQQVPLDLVFTGEDNQERPLREYFRGKAVILSLVYYECPMLCTLELNGLLRAMRGIDPTAGRDFDVLTISFDPSEKPELAAKKKAEYLEKYRRPEGAAGWHFLTGREDQIQKLTQTAGFRYVKDQKTNQWAHGSALMVLTPDGRLSRYLYGVEYSPRDLKLAIMESSQGRIGMLADQVQLFCYHYDPLTGKYGMAVMTAVRTGGILTILGLLAFWGIMYRQGRKAGRRTSVDAGGFGPRGSAPGPVVR